MRGYIFTETEREQLKQWIKEGKEPKTLQVLFSRMRRTDIMPDIKLYLEARKKLTQQQRWKLNVPRSTYASHLDGLASTPRRKEQTM